MSGVGLLAPKINLSSLEAEMHQQSTAICCLHSNQSSFLWIHCRFYSQLPSFPTSHPCHHPNESFSHQEIADVPAQGPWCLWDRVVGVHGTQGAKTQLDLCQNPR